MFKKGEKQDSNQIHDVEEVHEGSPGSQDDPPSPTFGKPNEWSDIKNTGVTGKSHHQYLKMTNSLPEPSSN